MKIQHLKIFSLAMGVLLLGLPLVFYVVLASKPIRPVGYLSLIMGSILLSYYQLLKTDSVNGHRISDNFKRVKKFLAPRLLISLVTFVLMFVLLEGFARIWVLLRDSSEMPEVIGSPYINEPEFVAIRSHAEFIIKKHTSYVPEKDLFLFSNYASEYLNIVDNKRVTTDQPDTYVHTIYMFGGSTMTSMEVPDAYTIPSFLQRMVNEDYPDTYRVENYGVNAYAVARAIAKLIWKCRF